MAAARPMDDVCPWDAAPGPEPDVVAGTSSGSTDDGGNYWPYGASMALPPDTSSRTSRKNSSQLDSYSSSSDVSSAIVEASDRLRKSCGLQHSSSIVVVTPSITRNYSVGSTTSGKVKLAEASRSSMNYPSPQQSFDLGHYHYQNPHHYYHQQHSDKPVEIVKSVPEEIETVKIEEIKKKNEKGTLAPLISISAIVGELTGDSVDSEKSVDESVTEVSGEDTVESQGNETVKAVESDPVEEAQVVPVWEPQTGPDPNQATGSVPTVNVVPQEQRDNNVNEVCPWEDE